MSIYGHAIKNHTFSLIIVNYKKIHNPSISINTAISV